MGSQRRAKTRTVEFVTCVLIVPLILVGILWVPINIWGLGATADFIQFYSAGRLVVTGQAPQLYYLAQHSEVLRQFTHPPFEAVFYAPFALFPYVTAFRLWTCMSFCFLGLIFFLLRPYGNALDLPKLLLLLAVGFYPILTAIIQGQDSILVLFAFTLVFLAVKNNLHFWSGIFLGIGLVKPQFVVPYALLLIFHGHRKFIVGFVSSVLLLTAVSVLVFSNSVLTQYPAMLLHMNDPTNAATFHLYTFAMPNIRGICALLLSGVLSRIGLDMCIGVLSLALLAWTSRIRDAEEPGDLSFSLSVVVALLVSFHLLIHDLSLILLPVYLFLNHLQKYEPEWTLSNQIRVFSLLALFLTILIVQLAGSKDFAWATLPMLGFCVAIRATQTCNPGESAGL